MKQTVTAGSKSRAGVLRLQCPECTRRIRVAPDELFDGAVLQCDHCGCEAELTREFELASGRSHWVLLDPLTDFDEEGAPRD